LQAQRLTRQRLGFETLCLLARFAVSRPQRGGWGILDNDPPGWDELAS